MMKTLGFCALALTALQSQDQKLTREAILAVKDLKGIELTLCHHPGDKSEGQSTIIKGDGSVVQTWNESYPLTAEEKVVTRKHRMSLSPEETLKLVRLFAHDGVLALPKIRPDLVTPKEVWPKSMRYSLGLSLPGAGSFEGEHPDVEGSKLPQSPAARLLIQAIRTSVRDLADRISSLDTEFLSKERLGTLAGAGGFVLELRDIQGLWGGTSLRVHSDGLVEGVKVRPPQPPEQGMQVRHFKGRIDKARAARILGDCATWGTFDLRPRRKTGIPDEAYPMLTLKAAIDGAVYSRVTAFWEGEARETPAFQKVRKALQEIADEIEPKR
ncbi:MAG: hypothetical protein HY293_22275 [Planctomycetes bacterium]|nr:hypothetical protein [Planctomycetota bacterium]